VCRDVLHGFFGRKLRFSGEKRGGSGPVYENRRAEDRNRIGFAVLLKVLSRHGIMRKRDTTEDEHTEKCERRKTK